MSIVSRVSAAALLCLSSLLSASGQTNVLTQHNDNSRTGQNTTETILNPTNVSSGNFGLLTKLPIDGPAFAQPLYMTNLNIAGVAHSVVFVATEHDSVYAYDAGAGGQVIWKASLFDTAHGAAAGATADPEPDTGCLNANGPEFGISGTPVIDPTTNTMYLVSKTFENDYPVQRLHALDVTSGAEKFGGPVTIQATVAGTGNGSVNGQMTFDPKWEMQRPGLLLLNGTVYIGWGSVCDYGTWHGWVMGYNAATLTQTAAFNTTPNGTGSGVWMSGAGLASDNENGVPRMFVPTGNGTYDATTPYGANTMDYGDDIVTLNLTSGIKVTDAFTPSNQAYLEQNDVDVASGGLIVLPDNMPGSSIPHEAVQMSKAGVITVLNRDNLGGYNTTDQALQEINPTVGTFSGLWGMPAYWNGNLYVWPSHDQNYNLLQYQFTNGLLSSTPVAQSTQSDSWQNGQFLGSSPSVSSNGTSEGIVWVDDTGANLGGSPQFFYALDATNVAKTLWSSTTNPRDNAGIEQHFAFPTIADGKVYLASIGSMLVYGMLDFAAMPPSAVAVNPGNNTVATIGLTASTSFTQGISFTASGLPSGVTLTFSQGTSNSETALFTATSSAATGTSSITITASRGTTTQSATVPLTVGGLADFVLSAAPATVDIGTTGYSAITAASQNGFSGIPSFSIVSVSAGLTATLTGCSSSGCTLLTSASAVTTPGSYAITVQATSGTLTHLVNAVINVTRTAATNVNMSSFYNVSAIATDGTNPVNGGLDGGGFAFSGKLLGTSLAWSGTTFNLGPANAPDSVSSTTVTLPAGNYVNLQMLASGGGAIAQPFVVNYTDGSTTTFTQSYSNWGNPSSYSGESIADSMAYRIIPGGGTQTGPWSVYGYTFPLNNAKTVQSVTLPPTGSVVVLAIALSSSTSTAQTIFFNPIAAQQAGTSLTLSASASSGLAVTYSSSTTSVCTVSGNVVSSIAGGTCTIIASQPGNATYAAATSVSQSFTINAVSYQAAVNLAASYNVAAISAPGTSPTNSGFDGSGFAYDGSLLGTSANWAGTGFNFGPANAPDAVSSVTVPLPAGKFSSLQMLASASYGNQANLPFLVTYSDGSTTTFTQSVSDWGSPQNFSGESSAVKMSDRVTPNGTTQTLGVVWNVYGYSFALNSAKTVSSITLPNTRSVVALAMTLLSNSTIAQSISFPAIAAQKIGSTLVLAASASSSLAVTYASSTPAVCTVSGSSVSTIAAGTCTITASQPGNSSYAAATPVSQSFTVNTASQTITFGSIGTQTAGTSITLNATASSSLAVAFTSSTSAICTVSGNTASLLTSGTCTILASQAGNSSYAAATPVTQSFPVSAPALQTQTINFSVPGTQRAPASVALSAAATSGLAVVFTSSTTSICTVSGTTASLLASGTCTVVASQPGNSSYAAATPVTQTFTVAPPQVQVGLSSVVNVAGIVANGSTVTNSGLDGGGYAYSANVLGTTAIWNGATFTLGATGVNDAVTSVKIPLPAGSFASLQMLATGVNGTPVNQPFIVTYSDGTTTTFTQSLSDWGNYPLGYAGESIAVSMPYRLVQNGTTQTLGVVWNIYGYSFALNSAKTVSSITLPSNRSVVVMAMTLSPTAIAQTLTFPTIASQVVAKPLTLTATSSSGLVVAYTSSTTSVCTVSGSTATLVAAGTCTITAAQPGNSSFAAATPIAQSFSVTSH